MNLSIIWNDLDSYDKIIIHSLIYISHMHIYKNRNLLIFLKLNNIHRLLILNLKDLNNGTWSTNDIKRIKRMIKLIEGVL
jgi:hypothetical protein